MKLSASKKGLTGLTASALFSLLQVLPAFADSKSVNFSGSWKNQRGSKLIIEKSTGNEYKGVFITAVAETKKCIGKPIPVVGIANKNAISLSASMENCGSPVTLSISGLLREKESGKEVIETLTLALKNGIETWKSRITTIDTFERKNKKQPLSDAQSPKPASGITSKN